MRRFIARHYDRLTAAMEEAWLDDARRDLVGDLRGTVVEIGAGTGKNLRHYPGTVERLVLLEPTGAMRDQLHDRVREVQPPFEVEIGDASAEHLPLADGEADAVVSTLVLCSAADLRGAAREIRRVLRPGGEVRLIEHVVSDRPRERRWQQRLDRPWNWLEGSCHLDHDTAAALREAGFDVDALEAFTPPRQPPLFRAMLRGRVTAA